jgi:hypothetical protein
LSGTRQPCLAPYKSGGRQDRLVCRKTRLTGERLDLSTARQAYPPPANVIGSPTSLSAAKQPCRRQNNLVGFQDKVVGGKITFAGARTTLSTANQGCLPGNKVVSPRISLSAPKQPCRAPRQGCCRQDNVRGSQDNVIRGKSRLPAGKQGCLAADKLVSLPTSLRRSEGRANVLSIRGSASRRRGAGGPREKERRWWGGSPLVGKLPSPGGAGVRLGEGSGVRAAGHGRPPPPTHGLSRRDAGAPSERTGASASAEDVLAAAASPVSIGQREVG